MSIQSDIKKLIKDLKRQGWREEIGRHIKMFHPKGGFVTISISPSCHHALKNIQGDINRLEKFHARELA